MLGLAYGPAFGITITVQCADVHFLIEDGQEDEGRRIEMFTIPGGDEVDHLFVVGVFNNQVFSHLNGEIEQILGRISRIGQLSPTPILSPMGRFEIASEI